MSAPLQRLEVERITGHQSVRGRGGVIAVMYETHWTGLSRPSWEREIELQLSRQQILLYWTGTPNQHRQTNRLHRQMRIGADNGSFPVLTANVCRHLAIASCRALTGYATAAPRCSPMRPIFGTKPMTACGCLGKLVLAHPSTRHIWYVFWTTRDRSSFLSLQLTTRLRQEVFKAPGAFHPVGVDQVHAGFKAT